MKEELENIELRSEEVQEILGHIPASIIRYGITVIISVILVLFAGSFFFKYPDILMAPVEVVSENPPAGIVAKVSGNLTHVYVADSQAVISQQKLAVIKNSAHLEDIELLALLLENRNTKKNEFNSDGFSQFPDSLALGDIQNSYSTYLKSITDYKQFVALNYYPRKITALQQKQLELQKYAKLMLRQVNIKALDYELAENQFLRDSGLFAKQVISLASFEQGRAALLQNSLSLENARSAVVTTNIQMYELEQQIADLESEEIRQVQNFQNALSERVQILESRLAWWFDTYMLVSPIDGIVAFNTVWSNNQFVQAGNEVFTILPFKQSNIIGRITLPVQGAGKVKMHQAVNLKFDNYPYQEFGMVTAYVSSISMVPSEQNYMVEVQLADTLITNYGDILPFSQKMGGTAEIITEDLPLIVRLFNPLKAILKKHLGNSNSLNLVKVKEQKEVQLPEILKIDMPESGDADNSEVHKNRIEESINIQPIEQSIRPIYHIIVGSFLDKNKAEKELIVFQKKGYTCQIILNNGRFRLSIFSEEDKALSFKEL